MSGLAAGAGFTLIAIGAIMALYYFSINVYCDPVGSCGAFFVPEKITSISFLVTGAALVTLNYAKNRKAVSSHNNLS